MLPGKSNRIADQQKYGPALEGVFMVLSNTSAERLLSLTFKLGNSEMEKLVHAMVLITLSKRAEALAKLKELSNNNTADCLVKMLTASDYPITSISSTQAEILTDLARIFKVLADEKLCNNSQRDKAYEMAIKACENAKGKSKVDLELLRKEARDECGPHVDTGSPQDSGTSLKSGVGFCLPWNRGPGTPAIPIRKNKNPSRAEQSSPSSLRTCRDSQLSHYDYPSHLEVSASPTALHLSTIKGKTKDQTNIPSNGCQEKMLQSMRGISISSDITQQEDTIPSGPVCAEGEGDCSASLRTAEEESGPSINKTLGDQLAVSCNPEDTMPSVSVPESQGQPLQCTEGSGSHQIVTSKSNSTAQHSLVGGLHPETKPSQDVTADVSPPRSDAKEEEVGAMFYCFVILHDAEDTDVANALCSTLENLGTGEGATFSDDFAMPGKHILTCIQDAIDNSAYTILLLTQNFKTRLLEHKTNSVLMNSIEKHHKYNTVIPFLPKENCLPSEKRPMCLKHLIPLNENAKNFQSMVRKTFSPDKIKKQRELWSIEQTIKKREEMQVQLREKNTQNEHLVQATVGLTELQQQQLNLQYQLLQTSFLQGLRPPQAFPNPQQVFPMQYPFPFPPPDQTYPMGQPYANLYNMPPPYYQYPHYPMPQQMHNPDGCQSMGFIPGTPRVPCQPPNIIQIHNASHIMIGNESTMRVERVVEGPEEEAEDSEDTN
ncbi:TIR domain-containing adapter molecule 1 [Amia ocellicauda]|uniref:TIR domain-containing adapter molecule 1 n=1 Tax=Amia ocellicauda TaxID=2972642 RepID=UPI003464007E